MQGIEKEKMEEGAINIDSNAEIKENNYAERVGAIRLFYFDVWFVFYHPVCYNKKRSQNKKQGDTMIVNIAVCDDKQEVLNIIRQELVKAADNLNIIIETFLYTDGNEVADLICNQKEDFDILFLDIDMPDISGLEVAKKIRKSGSDIILIFISAHEQYVFESIDYSPFKYIRKNKMADEIEIALKRAYRRILEERGKSIVTKTEDGEVCLKHSDIMYFEMNDRRINIFTNDMRKRVMIGRKTIKELYNELDDRNFVQIHSGCIVNTKYIDQYSNHDITLDDGTRLIVSRSRIKVVKETMARYWSERV